MVQLPDKSSQHSVQHEHSTCCDSELPQSAEIVVNCVERLQNAVSIPLVIVLFSRDSFSGSMNGQSARNCVVDALDTYR